LFIPDPGYQIRMLTFYPSRILDPGVKKAPDPGSGSATLLVKRNREAQNIRILRIRIHNPAFKVLNLMLGAV
jgi:hypothetical protein